jgi:hypothetical protein
MESLLLSDVQSVVWRDPWANSVRTSVVLRCRGGGLVISKKWNIFSTVWRLDSMKSPMPEDCKFLIRCY